MNAERHKYLELLAKSYPNAAEVGKEIILKQSILNLPKSAELFLSDIHGEHEPFMHVLKNGSGSIRKKIDELFKDELDDREKRQLASLIYYPEQKLELIKASDVDLLTYYQCTIDQLVRICRDFTAIYASKRVDQLLPSDYGEVIRELMQEREYLSDRENYFNRIVESVIDIGQADRLIVAFAYLIQKLAIHKIHIIGDVYDRGPSAESIMDYLMSCLSVDFQWGNHDMVWMGAAAGNEACIASVLRLSLRYGNTDTLEKGYGINLIPLASFAIDCYRDDTSVIFEPKLQPDQTLAEREQWLSKIMHKAISIIEFKLEGQLIKRRPEFHLENRLLLDKIDYEAGKIRLDGQSYDLKDAYFPTIDPNNPYQLSDAEAVLMVKLSAAFADSLRLHRHVRYLYERGSMYKVTNNHLLYHGCIPLTEEGQLADVDLGRGPYHGKALLDQLDRVLREAYFGRKNSADQEYALDLYWYMWAGPYSPIFGKDKMATFERYFTNDKQLRHEEKNPYYQYRDNPETAEMILQEFGLDPETGIIVNGHVPVVVKEGENPVKANGKLIVIDGGFAKAYQEKTGIAGYTLLFDANGLQLIAQEPFVSTVEAISRELDIAYSKIILNQPDHPLKVKDLDDGDIINSRINDLKELLACYQRGLIKESFMTIKTASEL